MSKHTPGPWTKVDKWNIAGHNDGKGGRYVCSVCDWSTPTTSYMEENKSLSLESSANARLIAAAPELLAALKQAMPLLCRYAMRSVVLEPSVDRILPAMLAAISKAEGGDLGTSTVKSEVCAAEEGTTPLSAKEDAQ